MIVMGHHSFKDRALIKRQWATQKTNKMGKKLMDENKQGNRRMSISVVAGGHVFPWSYSAYRRMNAKSAIKKLQKVTREKEAQRLEHKRIEKVEGEVLKKNEEKVLKARESVGVLNI